MKSSAMAIHGKEPQADLGNEIHRQAPPSASMQVKPKCHKYWSADDQAMMMMRMRRRWW
jgi:hypothetical protein